MLQNSEKQSAKTTNKRTKPEDEKDYEDSDDFDEEEEFQPKKKKSQHSDFDPEFQFVSSVEEYNKDPWNDLSKYIKRKAKSKTDDKIKKIRTQLENEPEEQEIKMESDDSLSEDELKHDVIKEKIKKKKAKEEFFEEAENNSGEYLSFYEMNLSRPLLKAICQMNFIHPTPIQSSTIPIALLGKDICGCAATGTGKTAAYMLPTLERLLYRPLTSTPVTRVLVLVPTRELGVQVYQVTKQLCQFTDIQIGLAVGGLDLKAQEIILRKNPDIVVATPGRLIDHLKSTPTFSLDSIEVLILDEADRMLDEYFAEQMKEIIRQCARTRQTMLFSATMTEEVENLAALSLKKPVRLFVDSNQEVALNLRQEFVRIRAGKEDLREPILAALVCRTFRENCMVFVQTKKQAHRLHILLGLLGVKVAELHGNLTQPQRLDALEKFKNKEVDVLVATDVAARGLDISGVQTVINFTMPVTAEHYIHRVGRTARAGRAGVSVSLAGESERKLVKQIVKNSKNPVKSRVIPPDIIEKYKGKLEKIEPQIVQVRKEEDEERMINKLENQRNRAEKLLKGEKDEKRPWFQTKKERTEEKKKLTIKIEKPKDKNSKKQKNKNAKHVIDEESKRLAVVQAMQARAAKRKHKPKKILTMVDTPLRQKGQQKKKKTNFGDYTNTSRTNVKKLRYNGHKSEGKSAKKFKVKGAKNIKRKK